MRTANLFGDNLRRVRINLGISQSELAGLLGFTPSFICMIESGKRDPNVTQIFRMACVLGVAIDEFFRGAAEQLEAA